jgi:hypothetical protein
MGNCRWWKWDRMHEDFYLTNFPSWMLVIAALEKRDSYMNKTFAVNLGFSADCYKLLCCRASCTAYPHKLIGAQWLSLYCTVYRSVGGTCANCKASGIIMTVGCLSTTSRICSICTLYIKFGRQAARLLPRNVPVSYSRRSRDEMVYYSPSG